MNRIRWGATLLVALAVAISAVVYFRSSKETQAAPSTRDVPRLEGKWIRFSPEFAKRSSIAFAACVEGTLMPIVSVTGTVTFDPQRVAAVGSRIAGRVRRVAKQEGDAVESGEVIAEIESAELGEAQAAVTAARAKAEAAVANEARQRDLADSTRRRRARCRARARSRFGRARGALRGRATTARDGDRDGAPGVIALASPIAGKVVEIKASRGQSVEPSVHARSASPTSTASGSSSPCSSASSGTCTRATRSRSRRRRTSASSLKGTVAHVGDVDRSRDAERAVRVVVENDDGSLRPGQSVLAKIHTTTHAVDGAPRCRATRSRASTASRPCSSRTTRRRSSRARSSTRRARRRARRDRRTGLAAGERVVVERRVRPQVGDLSLHARPHHRRARSACAFIVIALLVVAPRAGGARRAQASRSTPCPTSRRCRSRCSPTRRVSRPSRSSAR